jgi:hypothetical protein
LRANGTRWNPDRSRSVGTLCVQERFGDRLDAATRWAAGDRQLQRGEHRDEPAKILTPEEDAELDAFWISVRNGELQPACAK